MKRFVSVVFLMATVLFGSSAFASESGKNNIEVATFGGGCFWCLEGPFDRLPGVLSTISGFSGGHTANPSYKQVSYGGTGHTEVVQVTYDASIISYEKLLDVYWRNIDPIDDEGQFCDRGHTYRPVIFSHNKEQANSAELSKQSLMLSAANVTPVEEYINFFAAEDYHQNYYTKNPLRYKYYRRRCGRDQRLEELWGASH